MATFLSALLTLLSIIVLLVCVVLLLFSIVIIYGRVRYRHIPCPQPVSFFLGHLPYLKKRTSNDCTCVEEILCEWAEAYGYTYVLYLLHQPVVLTCNPENIKELQVTGNFPKSRRYTRLSSTLGQRVFGEGLVTDVDHERWSIRRHHMNPAFHRQVLKEFMKEFNSTGNEFIHKLGEKADSGEKFQVGHLLHKATLDVIGKVAFDKELQSLSSGNPFNKALFDVLFVVAAWLKDPLLALPLRGAALKSTIRQAGTCLREVGQQWIQERRAAIQRDEYVPQDILTTLVKLQEQYPTLPEEIILDDFVTFFLAGQETTANAVSFVLMQIGRHPEVLQRMYTEVDEVVGSKAEVGFEDVNKLEYVGMVWKETLRLYPPVPVTFRDVNRQGYKIDGYEVPYNTQVLMTSYVSGRMETLVKDPLTFNPDRFAPDSPLRPNTYAYFPFALGPRNCIGQTFAQLEGKVLLCKILQNFNFELDPNQSFAIQENTTLRPKDGVKCNVSWRKSKKI